VPNHQLVEYDGFLSEPLPRSAGRGGKKLPVSGKQNPVIARRPKADAVIS